MHYQARRIISSGLIAKGLVWLAMPISEYVFIAAWLGLGWRYRLRAGLSKKTFDAIIPRLAEKTVQDLPVRYL
ncbi:MULTISPECIES: hypothetical protein [Pantoea]|uniref:Uncharacterized protein n=1 Tax=Candidatus Pantoea gossypiicola TaxID=2608008 RepID=A0AB34CHW4_9GAMM|nr:MULTISPECIES: hypothetical protein [Pantoea]KAA5921499.1 hypothetical protein F3I59_22875 [Pantoea sp. VH_8]KAA5927920.1 hypothetical protein F3I58_23135 [Pantoea sp. VH_4]KAA5978527.1 hypothetical protein F3I49_22865 [Pantoea sp. M_4]KAA6121964.1 hypothetical protein F3I20_17455 [Pantoea gossypiicola]